MTFYFFETIKISLYIYNLLFLLVVFSENIFEQIFF